MKYVMGSGKRGETERKTYLGSQVVPECLKPLFCHYSSLKENYFNCYLVRSYWFTMVFKYMTSSMTLSHSPLLRKMMSCDYVSVQSKVIKTGCEAF